MSDILSPEQRARLAAMERAHLARLTGPPKDDPPSELAKWAGAVGCLLLIALSVALFAGLVAMVWRKAIGG